MRLPWSKSLLTTSLVAQTVKRLPAVRETQVRSLGWKDPLEKEIATHSSTLAWKIPWTEEPGRLQSMGLQRVGHEWVTSLLYFICIISHTPQLPWKPRSSTLCLREADSSAQGHTAKSGIQIRDAWSPNSRVDAPIVDDDGGWLGPGVTNPEGGPKVTPSPPERLDEVMSSVALLRFRQETALRMLLFCFPFNIFTHVSAQLFCPEAL